MLPHVTFKRIVSHEGRVAFRTFEVWRANRFAQPRLFTIGRRLHFGRFLTRLRLLDPALTFATTFHFPVPLVNMRAQRPFPFTREIAVVAFKRTGRFNVHFPDVRRESHFGGRTVFAVIALEERIHVLRLLVPLQLGPVFGLEFAQFTLEDFDGLVIGANVIVQVGFNSAPVIAHFAFIRLFAGVSPDVSREIGSGLE